MGTANSKPAANKPPHPGANQRYCIGQKVDVKDIHNRWYQAEVVELKADTYRASFCGFSGACDEWVDASRIAPLFTNTACIPRHRDVLCYRIGDTMLVNSGTLDAKNILTPAANREQVLSVISAIGEQMFRLSCRDIKKIPSPEFWLTRSNMENTNLVQPCVTADESESNQDLQELCRGWQSEQRYNEKFADVVVHFRKHAAAATPSADVLLSWMDASLTSADESLAPADTPDDGTKVYWSKAAHKVVLARYSAYFDACLTDHWKAPLDSQGRTVITVSLDVDEKCLEYLFRYMYGEICSAVAPTSTSTAVAPTSTSVHTSFPATWNVLASDPLLFCQLWRAVDFLQVESVTHRMHSFFLHYHCSLGLDHTLRTYYALCTEPISQARQIMRSHIVNSVHAWDTEEELIKISWQLLDDVLVNGAQTTSASCIMIDCASLINPTDEKWFEWLMAWKSFHPEVEWATLTAKLENTLRWNTIKPAVFNLYPKFIRCCSQAFVAKYYMYHANSEFSNLFGSKNN
jgi:hypothetical protein